MSNLEVIILAAGFGTRMKSSKSKVLFKLCGREMICHILQKSYAITVRPIHIGVIMKKFNL
ncbi:MAG: NTP transferase domain-containing protein [Campylobacter sp.]|nr:NTP transferase domain-containing protein [Campylobacter sp.]